ncbi:potassium-transporting ATPase subunit KdpB [Nakamurella aerolata]|uniref:Potassium-transporting ATPase ATP-binding subunit n=1 Tax=Nakamurella aerolata TaxID=1656892 RepID=A0A849ABY6_9ACTN|nr:potassium-transporting ATPase subunit KdpB [Nakamurella aerolata]NNG36000.1 potassium-transporting ATPase subunit KdpB [Nakamurella aerolata]
MTTPTLANDDLTALATGQPSQPGTGHRRVRSSSVFRPAALLQALPAALAKLNPRSMIRTPVMFVVLVGAVLCTVLTITDYSLFALLATIWLWLTVLFANVADAVAEGRGKAQAASLRAGRDTLTARKLDAAGAETACPAGELRIGDLVVCEAGDVIPGDGDVVEGVASVDESAITGESAPVVRESGGDRSAVTGGTRVLSDRIVVKVTTAPGQSFVDRMIALVEGSARQKTPNEIALNILLAALTIVFLLVVLAVQPMADYSGSPQSLVVLVCLLVCLIPTTIGALVSCIGVAGMDRLVQRNVLAMSGRAVEAAGDVSTLLLDKTGTITYGNRQAARLVPAPEVSADELRDAALLSSLADETPEGRSLVDLCAEQGADLARADRLADSGSVVEFSARTRMSGVDLPADAHRPTAVRKGAVGAVAGWLDEQQITVPTELLAAADEISAAGSTPLLVAEAGDGPHGRTGRALGVVELKDVVKPGIAERFSELRAMGIRTVMVTGDSQLTARSIAREAGVDDYLAEATPEDKLAYITREQQDGRIVAMTGDGTNDAPALAQADVGVAMNTGTAAAKEAGNMVDLDSSPTKLIDIVEIGKQLLITRGALTTFSLANDIAKYFAILPAMFASVYPGLQKLNIMQLSSPQSAILSAVIFNAVVIVGLIPLALKGVSYRPSSAGALLARNLLIYGVGGVVVPFVGIKLIDLLVSLIPGIG